MTKSYEPRPSAIHGRGVFARTTIQRGEFIGQYLAHRTDVDSRYTLRIEWDDELRGYSGYGSLRFVNHTSTPNAEFFERDLYATKTIRAGDEITVHYGEEWVGVS